MKFPSPSLAYRWTKYTMRLPMPAWLPGFYLALAVVFGATAVSVSPINWLSIAFVLAAIQEWQQRGYREIFAEQEARIAELQSPNAPPATRATNSVDAH